VSTKQQVVREQTTPSNNKNNMQSFSIPPVPQDLRAQDVFVNLEGDYSYLSDGYYRSMEAEHEGLLALPSPQAAIDAYVVPLALTKAKAAGIPTPEWEIVNDSPLTVMPPFVAYPINPFQDEGIVIAEAASQAEAFKSLTMSNKYAVVCQQMLPDSRIDTLRLVMGKCLKPEYAEMAEKLWHTFHIPLARVKIIVTEKQHLFSAIQPLKREELTQNEKGIIKEFGVWRG
jgi:glutathione synthase/RimK-type ligase-like ATP-grasp enzyme